MAESNHAANGAPPDGAPDWSRFEAELRCPRCEYNLRMLTTPRCPECGLEFGWRELISAKADERECPVFEYQWRRRPVRSFLCTFGLALLPWRLWRIVRLEFEPRLGPLLALTVITFIALHVISAGVSGIWQMTIDRVYGGSVGFWASFGRSFGWPAVTGTLQTKLAPLLIVTASIAIYRLTLVRFRIRMAHVIRIGLLAWLGWFGGAFVIGLILALTCIVLLLNRPLWAETVMYHTEGTLPLPALAIYFASIVLGFHDYMRLRRSLIAAIASMLLATVAITVFTLAYNTQVSRRTFGDRLAPLDEWIPGLQWFILRVLAAG